MPTPVSELIAQEILTTVQGVTTTNGANYTLTAQRHSRAGDKRKHLNVIINHADPTEVTGQPYNTKEWLQPYTASVFIIPDETDTTPIDQYVNLVRADIEKALMADRYRGGNALDTIIRAPQFHTDDEGWDALIVNFDVNYRTAEVDPYQNAK